MAEPLVEGVYLMRSVTLGKPTELFGGTYATNNGVGQPVTVGAPVPPVFERQFVSRVCSFSYHPGRVIASCAFLFAVEAL